MQVRICTSHGLACDGSFSRMTKYQALLQSVYLFQPLHSITAIKCAGSMHAFSCLMEQFKIFDPGWLWEWCGEAYNASVSDRAAPLARFGPPGSRSRYPLPGVSGLGKSCWPLTAHPDAVIPLEIMHKSVKYLHIRSDYSLIVASSAEVHNILWTTIRETIVL